jgi:hypothetical protein
MTNQEKIMWALGGILLGWLLNQASQWFRARIEDKKLFKQVLYNLLEIHHRCIRLETNNFSSKILEYLKKTLPGGGQMPKEAEEQFNTILTAVISAQIKPKLIEELMEMEAQYQKSVSDLAKVDPILSFYLSGKAILLPRIEEYLDVVGESVSSKIPDTDKSEISGVMHKMKPNILQKMTKELEDDAKSVALKVNVILYFKTKNTLVKARKQLDENPDEEFDEFMDSLGIDLNPE